MKHKRQPHEHASKPVAMWQDVKVNIIYGFFQGKQKKSPCFTGKVLGIINSQTQRCISVLVTSCRKNKSLVKKTITLSYVPSRKMWKLLKETKGAAQVYEVKKAA